MAAIEAASVIDGDVDADGNLILTTYGGAAINAGSVKGDKGDKGDAGNDVNAKAYSDTGDAATLASAKAYSDALVTATELGANVNLDTMKTRGYYTQSQNANITAGLNYPGTLAGLLEVFVNSTGAFVWQRYTQYGTYSNVSWRRAYYNGVWYPWALDGNGPAYIIRASHATLATATVAALAYDTTPLSGVNNGYGRATNTITVPRAGVYSLTYRFRFGGSIGTTRCFVEAIVGSVSQLTYTIGADTTTIARVNLASGEDSGILTNNALALNAGATIGINGYQTSGVSKVLDGVLTLQQVG
jgi:hypothetical protein